LPESATPGAGIAPQFNDRVASAAGQTIIREFGMAEYGEGPYNDTACAQ
jgi:tungstate transport system substrate-binding protein